MQGPSEGGVYKLQPLKQALMADTTTLDDWHARLGHPNYKNYRIYLLLKIFRVAHHT
jgi:hypothetical protein